jgi:anti-anti-sigma regulatory factor
MDFLVEEIDALAVFTVNLKHATFLESNAIKGLLDNYYNSGFIQYVVDLSQCEYIDPAFLSSLIIFLRTIVTKGGTIRIVKPVLGIGLVFLRNDSVRIFDMFDSRDDAIKSFKKNLKITLFNGSSYNNENLTSNM